MNTRQLPLASRRALRGCGLAATILLLAACGTQPVDIARDETLDDVIATIPSEPRMVPAPQGSGYYKDDGPHAMIPADLDSVPDAIPRVEDIYRPSLRPYRVMGQRFVPMTEREPFSERGYASWYGRKFHGRQTAMGEVYDMYAMTAAHPTLPLPSYVRVTHLENGRSVVVRVNDRGPFLRGRVIDLSYAAAHRLGFINAGSAKVEVELLLPEDMVVADADVRQMLPEDMVVADADVRQIRPVYVADATPRAAPRPATAAAATPVPAATQPLTDGQRAAYLQLGAFDTPANAAKLMARARAELQMVADQVHLLDGDGRYRLQIGPFASVEEARSFAGHVINTLDLNPYLVMR